MPVANVRGLGTHYRKNIDSEFENRLLGTYLDQTCRVVSSLR
jgi:hypothetical protein